VSVEIGGIQSTEFFSQCLSALRAAHPTPYTSDACDLDQDTTESKTTLSALKGNPESEYQLEVPMLVILSQLMVVLR